jgi:hypothetical protein
MSFKGLEDRFKQKMTEIYGANAKDNNALHPLVVIRPDDPNRDETAHDTRATPIGSIKRDVIRIGKYSKSRDGLLFLAKQELLQLGNAISETKIINPLFVIGNLTPYIHLSRTLASPKDFDVRNKDETTVSPGSADIGGAGRMQVQTAKDSISRVVGQSGRASLLSWITPSKLKEILNFAFSIKNAGTTGQDGRPELTIDGSVYYSVLLWQQYKKTPSVSSTLSNAKRQLRVGNFKGAVKTITNGFKSNLQNFASTGLPDKLSSGIRGVDETGMEGRRYFITSKDDADRYLKSTDIGSSTYPSMPGKVIVPFATQPQLSPKLQRAVNTVNKLSNKLGKDLKKVTQAISKTITAAEKIESKIQQEFLKAQQQITTALGEPISTENNPAEANMLFPRLSLRERYLQDSAASQLVQTIIKDSSTNYWAKASAAAIAGDRTLTPNNINGFSGGITFKPGTPVDDRYNQTRFGISGYLQDNYNAKDLFNAETADDVRKAAGSDRDVVDLFFTNVIDKMTIPFRAYISNIVESINPQYNEVPYIGRIEQNITYMRVKRQLTFGLHVYSLSSNEFNIMWNKLDRLKGLCFPSQYDRDNGFMVPPLIKLTMGNLFRDQPGYITSLVYNVEEGTSWEIDAQLPRGIVAQVQFSILEKQQMHANSQFTVTAPIT